MDIGERIKIFRKSAGLTQEQLAKNSGLSRNAIYNYENGRRSPDIETLNKIAAALGVTSNELLGLSTNSINLSRISTPKLIEELNSRDDFPIKIAIKNWK